MSSPVQPSSPNWGQLLLYGVAGWLIGSLLIPKRPSTADYEEFLDAYEAGEVDEENEPVDEEPEPATQSNRRPRRGR
jgi:hypothetical protein